MNYDEKNFLIRLFTAMFQGLEHHNCSVIPDNTKQADIFRLIIFRPKNPPNHCILVASGEAGWRG